MFYIFVVKLMIKKKFDTEFRQIIQYLGRCQSLKNKTGKV